MAEFEIKNFIGIQSSNVLPPPNACTLCDNLDVRGTKGALVTRTGYSLKYDKPSTRTIVSGTITVLGTTTTNIVTNITTTANQYVGTYLSSGGYERLISSHTTGANTVFTVSAFPSIPSGTCTIVLVGARTDLGMCNFYVPDNGGQEVTVLVQKGTMASERALDYQSPTSLNILLIWIRPYWSGSAWVDSWQWLNECVYTTINDIDPASAGDNYKIELDFTDSTLKTDGLNKWTIIHLASSPKETAKVIKTYEGGTSNQVAIKISRNNIGWQEADPSPPATAGDAVIIMRNYIPYEYLTGMYSCSASDVVFHKVLNDVRIGFGGQANRLGLSIGYRKKYWAFDSFDFGVGDTDLTDSSAKEEFAKIDEIILTPYNTKGMNAWLDFEIVAGSMAIQTHYFRLTGILDDYEEMLISEQEVILTSAFEIRVNPFIEWGTENKRLTALRIWYSSNGDIYNLITETKLSQSSYVAQDFYINSNGIFLLINFSQTNLHTHTNAATLGASDENDYDGWSKHTTFTLGCLNLASVNATPSPDTGCGTYSIKITQALYDNVEIGALYDCAILANTLYKIRFKVIANAIDTPIYAIFKTPYGKIYRTINPTTTWQQIDFNIKIADWDSALIIGTRADIGDWIAFDQVEIYKYVGGISATDYDSDVEIVDELGYSPSTNLALSWDQAVVAKGKTYMISPYFADGGRILNNIFYSPLSGDGERQYDVITPGLFLPGESFDANDLIGLQLLPNMDFLGIRRNGVQWIDSENGVSKQILYGNGAVGNRAIVNFGEYIIFPGENDIIMANPLRAEDISDGTIRETYRVITTKTNIIATREEKDNAYRMFTGNTTTKQEYLLTKKGWIGAKRYIYPVAYTIAKDGTVWFLGSNGSIYYDDTADGDNGAAISYKWRSIAFDLSLMGENIKQDMRFSLQSLWFRYNLVYPGTAFTVKVYLDKACNPNDYYAGATYIIGDVVEYGGTRWKSLQNANSGNTPSESAWWTAVSYYQTFNVNANYSYFTMPLLPGASCRTFQIEISGSDAFGGKVQIYSIGVEFKVIPIGIYAKIP